MEEYYSLEVDQFGNSSGDSSDIQGRRFYTGDIKCQETDPLDMLYSAASGKVDGEIYIDPVSGIESPVYVDPLSDSPYCHLTLQYYEYRGINVSSVKWHQFQSKTSNTKQGNIYVSYHNPSLNSRRNLDGRKMGS